MSFDLAKQLKINDPWRLELASTFTYLGHVGLPDSVQKDVYDQNDLSQEVREIISGFPEFIGSVLGEIPSWMKSLRSSNTLMMITTLRSWIRRGYSNWLPS